jgi:hypothetical protein
VIFDFLESLLDVELRLCTLRVDPLLDTELGESGALFGTLDRVEHGDLERERDLESDRAMVILDFFARWLGAFCATPWLPRLITPTPPLSMATEADEQTAKCATMSA